MQTRRDLFRQALALPLASLPRSGASIDIIARCDLLSEESAAGFRFFVKKSPVSGDIIILPNVRNISAEYVRKLRERAMRGAWIIWEQSPCLLPSEQRAQGRIFQEAFGRKLERSIVPPETVSYIQYFPPRKLLTRTFLSITPIECPAEEVIGTCGSTRVSGAWSIGSGGVIFLGSMLGPQLKAEDREARRLGTYLLAKPA